MAHVTAAGTERVRNQREADARTISIITLGQALSAFFIVSFTLCIIGCLIWPNGPILHEALAIFLPGFTLLSWHTFFLGLFESIVWGWYIAIVFGAIYNFFLCRAARGA